jgi:hypothetical protein
MSPLFGTRYSLTLILGRGLPEQLWHVTVWPRLFIALESFARDLGHAPSLRVNNCIRDRDKYARPPSRPWTLDDHLQWCDGSPDLAAVQSRWVFVDAQLFIPPKPECLSRNRHPDAFIHIVPTVSHPEARRAYSQFLLVAIKTAHVASHSTALRQFASSAYAISGGVLMLEASRRIWSLNEFESVLREGFLYRGCFLEPLPDLTKPKLKWVPRAV